MATNLPVLYDPVLGQAPGAGKAAAAAGEAPGVAARAGSWLKDMMGKVANLSMPTAEGVGRAVGTATRVAPAAVGLAQVDLGARAVTAGLNNTFGPGDNAIEEVQGKLQTDPLAQYLPTWVDQVARGAESAVARVGDTIAGGRHQQNAIEARDLKKLGLDDASFEANGKLDGPVWDAFRARQAAKAGAAGGLPPMEDLMPAREGHITDTNPNSAIGKAIMKENTLFSLDKSEQAGRGNAMDTLAHYQAKIANGTAGEMDQAYATNLGLKIARMAGGQKVAQQNADTHTTQLDVTQRGQDMTFMPHAPELQRQKQINELIARGDLEGAHRIAALGKAVAEPHATAQSGDIASDTPAGVWIKGKFYASPKAAELNKKAERAKQVQNVQR